MKKTILIAAFSLSAMLNCMAQGMSFTDNLQITINEITSEPQKATVDFSVSEDQTKCSFTLNDFMLVQEGEKMPVGNIIINDMPFNQQLDSLIEFSFQGNITISNGSDEDMAWIGPMLGEIPLKLWAVVSPSYMYVTIDIDLQQTMGQIVNVTFGKGNPLSSVNQIKDYSTTQTYNLMGMPVSGQTRGIVIENGKKVFRNN